MAGQPSTRAPVPVLEAAKRGDSTAPVQVDARAQIFERVAGALPNVAFYDTWTEFAKPDGGYTAYWRDGNNVNIVLTPWSAITRQNAPASGVPTGLPS